MQSIFIVPFPFPISSTEINALFPNDNLGFSALEDTNDLEKKGFIKALIYYNNKETLDILKSDKFGYSELFEWISDVEIGG
jgi:hypothetical protein